MSDKPPESPTTVKPLDLSDDEDTQQSGIMDTSSTKPTGTAAAPTTTSAQAATVEDGHEPVSPLDPSSPAAEEVPPPKPPRPATEQQKNEAILKEAFPSIDAPVIKAVLIASGGRIDPAFNALLAMSDPDAVAAQEAAAAAHHDANDEGIPPPQPPRPANQNAQAQLEADEAYARRLAEYYESGAYEARTANAGSRELPGSRVTGRPGSRGTGLKPNELSERSFIDDDLPEIQEQLKKGFQETQVKVNGWFKDLKKKFDEQFDEGEASSSAQHGAQRHGGRSSGDSARMSRDYERYDADPQMLGDDFAGMKLHGDGTPVRQQNPNVFRPPPPSSTSPKTSDGRKVAFKDGADEINDIYGASPKNAPRDAPSSGGKTSKWQPLSTVDPNPIAENDPFSLGDSDDDKDATHTSKDKTDAKGSSAAKVDTDEERLRKAAAEAMSESLVDDKAKKDEVKK